VQFQTNVAPENSQPAHQLNWSTTFTAYKLNANPPDWLVKLKSTREDQVRELKAEKVGTSAPDFKLQDLDGQEVSLADLRDRVVLLDFWATWCLPCRKELPVITKIERDWSAKGLTVLRITNEEPDVVKVFLKGTRLKFVTLVNGADVSRQYSVDGIPTIVLIDKTGKIVAYDVAELSEAELVDRLRQAGLKTR
jgi:thiol-disulfide isomerase/thioredoxin